MGIGKRIEAAMLHAGKTAADIAKHLKISESAVSQWLTKDTGPRPERLPALTTYLGVNRAWLQWDEGEMLESTPPSQKIALEPPQGLANLPVWASAEAGDDGAMILTSEPIDRIHRSEKSQRLDSFAFHVLGSSMSPAIEHGDQVVVSPSLPVRPGDDCVFVTDDGEGTMLALVKRLVRIHPDRWRVRQFNEPKDFDLPKKKWAKALKIVEKRYA